MQQVMRLVVVMLVMPIIFSLEKIESALYFRWQKKTFFPCGQKNIIDSLSLVQLTLSPLKGGIASLTKFNKISFHYGTSSGYSLAQSIEILSENSKLRKRKSLDVLDLFREKFSFDKVFGELVKHLESLSLIKRENEQR
mgnify:CR=1 FL=1